MDCWQISTMDGIEGVYSLGMVAFTGVISGIVDSEGINDSSNDSIGIAWTGLTAAGGSENGIKKTKNKTILQHQENLDKSGVFIGYYAINPINQKISSFILMTMFEMIMQKEL